MSWRNHQNILGQSGNGPSLFGGGEFSQQSLQSSSGYFPTEKH
jgi:hypothetical protein